MTCGEAQRRFSRAVDGSAADAEFWRHLEACHVCSRTLEEHATVRYVLSACACVRVPSDFSTRVRARIERRASLVEWTDWKPWTLRLAPVAAGLILIARLWFQQTPLFSLETLMEHWIDDRGHVPATGLFWHDAPDEILLEAVLDGRPETAMRDYYIQGPHDQ